MSIEYVWQFDCLSLCDMVSSDSSVLMISSNASVSKYVNLATYALICPDNNLIKNSIVKAHWIILDINVSNCFLRFFCFKECLQVGLSGPGCSALSWQNGSKPQLDFLPSPTTRYHRTQWCRWLHAINDSQSSSWSWWVELLFEIWFNLRFR